MNASLNPISSRHCWCPVPQPLCPALPAAAAGVGWGAGFLYVWTLVHFSCRVACFSASGFLGNCLGSCLTAWKYRRVIAQRQPSSPMKGVRGKCQGALPQRDSVCLLQSCSESPAGCLHSGEQLRKPSSWRSLLLPCSGILVVAQSLNHLWCFVTAWGILGSSFKLFAFKSLHQENPNQGTVLFNTRISDSEVTLCQMCMNISNIVCLHWVL